MGLPGFGAEDLLDYMGVTEQDRESANRRAARRQEASAGFVASSLGQAASAAQDVLQRDTSAKFISARQEGSTRNREEVETETVTTTTRRNIKSRHHNHDASKQWGNDSPSL